MSAAADILHVANGYRLLPLKGRRSALLFWTLHPTHPRGCEFRLVPNRLTSCGCAKRRLCQRRRLDPSAKVSEGNESYGQIKLEEARIRGLVWSCGVATVCAASIAILPIISLGGKVLVDSGKVASLAIAFTGTMAGAAALGHAVVPQLQRIKFGQVVRDDGPATHFSKAGTPTAGGIFFVPVALAATLILAPMHKETIAAVSAVTIIFLLGLCDDGLKLLHRNTRGVTARQKIMVQAAAGALFGAIVTELASPSAVIFTLFSAFIFAAEVDVVPEIIELSWKNFSGVTATILQEFCMMANGANLTDGLDGLCAGVSAIGLTCMALVGILLNTCYDTINHSAMSTTSMDISFSILGVAMAGSCVGFLHHNSFPARSFMGDAGSMAIGATYAAVGLGPFLLGMSTATQTGIGIQYIYIGLLLGVSLLFAIECVSVIIQVGYYKLSGRTRRVFLMAPIHHHFELKHDWHETQVVWRFYIAQGICAVITSILVYLFIRSRIG